jgi:hypothetical protein
LQNRDLGDFQTPLPLVDLVLHSPELQNTVLSRVIEPTCGRGNFIQGLLQLPEPPREIQAIELQNGYFEEAQSFAEQKTSTCIAITCGNLFHLNLCKDLLWQETGSLLIIGNPPWVTNAELGMLESDNLPQKKNIKRLRGIDARMGASNFDIAEYIWLKLIQELTSEQPTIALLCKISVARNVLQFAFDHALPVTSASIRMIDAKKWFSAAVDACLFTVKIGTGKQLYEAKVYQNLWTTELSSTLGIVGKHLVMDVEAYNHAVAIDGACSLTWRQGVKHDAASIMELAYDDSGRLWNKLHEQVIIEEEYLYPLLKSSGVFHGTIENIGKAIIIPQKRPGEDTHVLKHVAPQLWNYLMEHFHIFEQRKSSIYENQPPFAIFGIGEYSFALYKVAISGLHKFPRFRTIMPVNGRPVMLDDTCYFIPCYTAKQAVFLASLFNDPLCLDFIRSVAFLDAKRPITKKLLQRIDLAALFYALDKTALSSTVRKELERLGIAQEKDQVIYPSIEAFLAEYTQGSGYANALSNSVGTTRQLTWLAS